MENVKVYINVVKTTADFEVIEIMDEKDPSPALLGIDWAFYNNAILNLKQIKMSFETDQFPIVAPLDPSEGERFTEPINDEVKSLVLENIYNITTWKEDYVNPTADEELS